MRRWNVDHQPAIVDHNIPAVMPGESYEFTEEQIEAGLTGMWSETDPRGGLKKERAFKRDRDAKADAEHDVTTEPAEPGEGD